MNARSVVLWGFALATAPLIPACTTESPGALNPMEPSDGAAPDGASGGNDSGGATSRGDAGSTITDDDSGRAQDDSGSADGSHARESGECVRPPYQTTNACTGI